MWNWYIFRILRGSQFQVVQLYRIILRKSKTILVLFITKHYCSCITQFKFLCTAKSKTKVVFKTICWAACSWKFHQIGPLYYFIKIFLNIRLDYLHCQNCLSHVIFFSGWSCHFFQHNLSTRSQKACNLVLAKRWLFVKVTLTYYFLWGFHERTDTNNLLKKRIKNIFDFAGLKNLNCFVYWTLWTVYCILYTVYCIPYPVFSI